MKLVCRPIFHKPTYNARVEREVLAYFKETIYDPLFEILQVNDLVVRENDASESRIVRRHYHSSALWLAVMAGTVWYTDGVFYGAFTAEISLELRKLGAWLRGETFVLELTKMPYALRGVVAASAARGAAIHAQLAEVLSQMEEHLKEAPVGIDFANAVDTLTEDLQKQFIGTVPAKGDAPTPPSLPPDLPDQLEEGLTRTAHLSIKDFSVQQTAELRKRVLLNQSAGGRVDRLVKIIEADFGIAKRKAAFIAENETSTLVARFREDRFKAIGSNAYEWSTSEDEKVRPDHAALNHREFTWDNPPICDRATGRRCNPGEDYNCRCVPLAVLNVAA